MVVRESTPETNLRFNFLEFLIYIYVYASRGKVINPSVYFGSLNRHFRQIRLLIFPSCEVFLYMWRKHSVLL
jgi:hypothetical protein